MRRHAVLAMLLLPASAAASEPGPSGRYLHISRAASVELRTAGSGIEARFDAVAGLCPQALPADGGFSPLAPGAAAHGEVSARNYRFDADGCAAQLELLGGYVYVGLRLCPPATAACPWLAPYGLYRLEQTQTADAATTLHAHHASEVELQQAWSALLRDHPRGEPPPPQAVTQLRWQRKRDQLCGAYAETDARRQCLAALNRTRSAVLGGAADALAATRIRDIGRTDAQRGPLLDALRSPVEALLREPVLFAVTALRRAGDWAYARTHLLRPDRTPVPDTSELRALLRHDGARWRVRELEWSAPYDDQASWIGAHGIPPALFDPG